MQALIENNAVTAYPYGLGDFNRDHPGVLPDSPTLDQQAAVGLVFVADAPPPDGGMVAQAVETTPVLANGEWTQQWTLVPFDIGVIEQRFDSKLTEFFNMKAAERRYASYITCALRAGYVGPFQAEGTAFAQWMDACNAKCYSILGEVLAGQRPVPTWAEILAELPTLTWPT